VAGGKARTRSAFVTVDVPARDRTGGTGLAYVRIAAHRAVSHGVLTVARQFPYARTLPWRLTGTDGSRATPGRHTVYVQWRDVFGNWSSVHSDSIHYAP
jgi:hypothetical protein